LLGIEPYGAMHTFLCCVVVTRCRLCGGNSNPRDSMEAVGRLQLIRQ
jgi:hypothetical protein